MTIKTTMMKKTEELEEQEQENDEDINDVENNYRERRLI